MQTELQHPRLVHASRRRAAAAPRRGATLVIVAILITVLIGFVAMALDFSRMNLFKSELKTLSDAAAISATIDMFRERTEAQAETNAFTLISANRVEGSSSATMTATDITPVRWTFSTRTQSAAGSWTAGNGVAVTSRYTGAWTFAKIFGSSTRNLAEPSVAAYGSITTNTCIKPWAFPLASLLEKAGRAGPYTASDTLTASDVAILNNSTTESRFIYNDTPGATVPGSFGWVDINSNGGGNPNQNIADAIGTCTADGIGVGSIIPAFTGTRNAQDIRSAISALCGGTSSNGNGNGNGQGNGNGNFLMTCDVNAAPILIPIYSAGTGTGSNATYTVKYIGAFKMTRQDQDGLWGYLTSMNIPASGPLSNSPGPVVSAVIVN